MSFRIYGKHPALSKTDQLAPTVNKVLIASKIEHQFVYEFMMKAIEAGWYDVTFCEDENDT